MRFVDTGTLVKTSTSRILVKTVKDPAAPKLIKGWGVNDVDYTTNKCTTVGGKNKRVWICPYYLKWVSMIGRCYTDDRPTYRDCTITEDWKYLSNFIKWVDSQPNRDWENCDLDKDFIVNSNKQYSPETCVFIPNRVNGFIRDKSNARGMYMLGVCYDEKSKKRPYKSCCGNPFTGKQEYLGVFATELEAHKAWQSKKHEFALKLADTQLDTRVVEVLRQRYAPEEAWTNA